MWKGLCLFVYHHKMFFFKWFCCCYLIGKSGCEGRLIEEAMLKVCNQTSCIVAKFMKFHSSPHLLFWCTKGRNLRFYHEPPNQTSSTHIFATHIGGLRIVGTYMEQVHSQEFCQLLAMFPTGQICDPRRVGTYWRPQDCGYILANSGLWVHIDDLKIVGTY